MLWHPYEVELPLPPPDGSVTPRPVDGSTPDLTTPTPQTCAEALAGKPPGDGPYTLFVGGDGKKPWSAQCVLKDGMLLEYLEVNPAQNYSQYTVGGNATGMTVRTSYRRLRLDPVSLRVSCSDQTFADNNGNTVSHPNQPTAILVTSMPYAVAMGCLKDVPNGVANVDLGKTPFRVAANSLVKDGSSSVGNAIYDNNKHTVSLTGGGNCGYEMPDPPIYNPFNKIAGIYLPLEYAPPQ